MRGAGLRGCECNVDQCEFVALSGDCEVSDCAE